jgi:hypothetical protein
MKCPTAIFEEIGTDQLIRVVRGSIGYLVRIGQEGLGGPRTHMGDARVPWLGDSGGKLEQFPALSTNSYCSAMAP